MTMDAFLKGLLDGKLLEKIDVSDSFDEYLSARQNEVLDTDEYCRWEEERDKLEEGFLALYADPAKGRKDTQRYSELTSKMQGDSEMNNFKYGFNEGVKLLLHLMEAALQSRSGALEPQGPSQE